MMRVLVVDDEDAARKKVILFLQSHADCRLVGEAGDGQVALRTILERKPDLIFLDINMPGLDGFEVLAQLNDEQRPYVVFSTAYSDRAVRAFEVNAVDYLLKPFDRDRFDRALERVRTRMANQREDAAADVMRALQMLSRDRSYPAQLVVQDGARMNLVAVDTLVWAEAAGNYVVLHLAGGEQIMRTSLGNLLAKLDPLRFCRINRGHVVNLARIEHLEALAKGDMVLKLNQGTRLKLSRRYRDALLAALQAD